MKTIDENIQKQLDKPQTWFVKYFPKRIKNLSDESIKDRQLVYDFKDGKINGIEIVARVTANKMLEQYGDECTKIVFSCVPASSEEKNQLRYKLFSEMVCNMTGAINGFQYVNVIGERLAIHEHRSKEKEIRKVSIIEFDEKWFNGKQVLCFDDIITRGHSYANYANQLESMGANVIGGIFLARTHYRTNV